MIIPAILEKDFEEIKTKIALVDGFAKQIHIDVIDGKLYKNATFLQIEKFGALQTSAWLELHLIVQTPANFVKDIKNVRSMCAQVESENVVEFIMSAKDLGYKVGVSSAPETPNAEIEKYSANVDYVQFMTADPGTQGNAFKPEVLEKIRAFKIKFPEIDCQVDGSINLETIQKVLNEGIDNVVVGSYIFKSKDVFKAYKSLESLITK